MSRLAASDPEALRELRLARGAQVIPKERRTQLFSATMTTKVAKLQRACLRDPVKVEAAQKYSTVDTLRQQYLFLPAKHKVRSAASPLREGRSLRSGHRQFLILMVLLRARVGGAV